MEALAKLGEILLLACALALLIPSAFFLLECLLASRSSQPSHLAPARTFHTAVLIPARDEALGIAATLESVLAALAPSDRMLVVADNCTDNTAAIARGYGVQAIERHDTTRIGKGYALAFGVQHLAQDPPDVVIVLDADSLVERETLECLARRAHDTRRPVQATNRWRRLHASSRKLALSNFAFLVKNVVRPLGLSRMGAPCLLTGNGMAFPWAVLASAPLATGHLSEDMWLSVELTCAGHPPLFCSDALVYGEPPRREATAKTQRTRWEHGHLETMLRGIPKLVATALSARRIEPLLLAFELSVPPLSLLIMLAAFVLMISLSGALFAPGWMALLAASINASFLVMAVLSAWWKFGRQELPGRTLLAVPAYIVWKIPLYVDALIGRRTVWTRTERDSVPSSPTGGKG